MNKPLIEQLEIAKSARLVAIDNIKQTIENADYETFFDEHTTNLLRAQTSDIITLNKKIDNLYTELDKEIKEEKEF